LAGVLRPMYGTLLGVLGRRPAQIRLTVLASAGRRSRSVAE
jgi:hypothetical protein